MKLLAPSIFLDGSRIEETGLEKLLEDIKKLEWRPAKAGRYKDNQMVDAYEIKHLRDVHVSRDRFSDESEKELSIETLLIDVNCIFELNLSVLSRYVISKYYPGCHIKPHCDTDFLNTNRVVTGVFYLNEDYEGGEIYFPKFNVEIKPPKGSLLLFLSEYLHGVKPITNGNRYSVVWFAEASQVFKLPS